VKAKAVAGITLRLQFAHGLGLLHGGLKASIVLFGADRRIQIADFSPIQLDTGTVEPFSGEGWWPTMDLSGFASLLSEITIGASGGRSVPGGVPEFVSRLIEHGRSEKFPPPLLFVEIIDGLKENRFEIATGVDSKEVSAFVRWVESAEQSGKWEQTPLRSIGKVISKGTASAAQLLDSLTGLHSTDGGTQQNEIPRPNRYRSAQRLRLFIGTRDASPSIVRLLVLASLDFSLEHCLNSPPPSAFSGLCQYSWIP
jgi:hypothetical protein